jgi:3-dehydroquinate synthase
MNNQAPIFFKNPIKNIEKIFSEGEYSDLIFLVDSNTAEHCLPRISAKLTTEYKVIQIPAGEIYKNLDTTQFIWNELSKLGTDRNALLINLGGGVIGDMGGFAASTYKRGIEFVQVPTTLLSMVDASVGGKTGINYNGIKNSIGLFSNPKAVIVDGAFLKTLDKRQMLNGFAEMLKSGLIENGEYFYQLAESGANGIDGIDKMIQESIHIKEEIVAKDPFEKDERKKLNFGHTIGHGIESYSLLNDIDPLLHGEAIAVGMICESFLSNKISNLSDADLAKVSTLIINLFPTYEISDLAIDPILEFLQYDKKREGVKSNYTLISQIGQSMINQHVSLELARESIEYYQNCVKLHNIDHPQSA